MSMGVATGRVSDSSDALSFCLAPRYAPALVESQNASCDLLPMFLFILYRIRFNLFQAIYLR